MFEISSKDIERNAHICPCCGARAFNATAHVTQDWQIDEFGNFCQVIDDCVETTHYPDDEDIWDCDNCCYSSSGQNFSVKYWAHILEGITTYKDAVNALKKTGFPLSALVNIAEAWLHYYCLSLIEKARNCEALIHDSNGNILLYHAKGDDDHPEGWYTNSVEYAVKDLMHRPDAMELLSEAIHKKYEKNDVFLYGGKHFKPIGNLPCTGMDYISEIAKHQKIDAELGFCETGYVYHSKYPYTYNSFFRAVSSCKTDLFLCLENGKIYLPCEHDLQEYIGEMTRIRHE